MDGADGRFIPYLDLQLQLWREDGQDCGVLALPFLWHPTMHDYGTNLHLPEAGIYRARVSVETPRFCRHDRVNGRCYPEPVEVEFRQVHVALGRK